MAPTQQGRVGHLARGGALLVDKPPGPTSHQVVQQVRRALHERRVGHCGTLDPLASGLLVLVVGEATRLAAYVTDSDKAYRCAIELGLQTDTDDVTGRVLARGDGAAIDDAKLAAALDRLRDSTEQVPPDFSAVHVDGVRAHARARRGEPARLAPRPIRVRQLELLRRHGVEVEIELTVSKGTYVRALVRDLGRDLGCGATVAALRRLRAGHLSVAEGLDADNLTGRDGWEQLRPGQSLFEPDRRLQVDAEHAWELWRKGRARAVEPLPKGREPWIAFTDDDLVAVVAPASEQEELRVVRGFPPPGA